MSEFIKVHTVDLPKEITISRDTGQQVWAKCPYEWGIDDKVTIRTEIGTLILCKVIKISSNTKISDEIKYEPIDAADLPTV